MAVRITLSGRNDLGDARTVFADDVEIGHVQPSNESNWEAIDLEGKSHGNMFTSDWNAGKQLALGLGIK